MSEQSNEGDIYRVIADYQEATRRLEALLNEAGKLAERFERLAHGLSTRPARVIVGFPEQRIGEPGDWDIVPNDPLPTIEHLATLTHAIRVRAARVEALRERLILMGHADLVNQPTGFFQ